MDSSGSVGDLNWSKMKQFAIDISRSLTIGPNDVHVGMVSFGSTGIVRFQLSTYNNINALVNGIWAVPYSGGCKYS